MSKDKETITPATTVPSPPTFSLTLSELTFLSMEVLKLVQILKSTDKNHDYHETIFHTSTIIDQLLPKILIILFDMRANAYSMQGHFETAMTDAQRMIGQSPTMAEGYCRKANIFSTYGRMIEAIEAYDEGIQCASSFINSTSAQTRGMLLHRRSTAVSVNEKRVDPFLSFPIEIIDNIFGRISQTTRLTCLSVSKLWRKKVKECTEAWEYFQITDERDDVRLFALIPHIGYHIKHLEIDTSFGSVVNLYLKYMRNGTFKQINSIKMSAHTTPYLRPHVGLFTVALWQTKHTLTTLDLDFGSTTQETNVALSDILTICDHLTDLVCSVGQKSLSVLMGDFSTVDNHMALTNLQLKACTITGADLKSLLPKCSQLRRFVANGCESSTLSTISTHAKNLNILGFNPDVPVPQLPTKKIDNDGLRMLYTSNGPASNIPATSVLNIIYEHQKSLETVHVSMAEIDTPDIQQFCLSYPRFNLEHISNFTFRSEHNVQKIMLQSIQETASLKNLAVANVDDMNEFVNCLVNISSIIKRLEISEDKYHGTDYYRPYRNQYGGYQYNRRYAAVDYGILERLFKHYTNSHQSLVSITLRNCKNLNNSVLIALSKIKTLKYITLCSLSHPTTTTGIESILTTLQYQLVFVELSNMSDTIQNTTLSMIGNCCQNIKQIKLKNLSYVTDQGMRELVDAIKCSTTLDKLEVVGCQSISQECIEYAKQNLKKFVYQV